MKRTFKILCVLIATSLCIFATTLCGCSTKAKYVEGSFRITAVEDHYYFANIGYEYKISANKPGTYKIEFRADYGNNLSYTFSDSVTFKKSGVETDTGAANLDKPDGVNVSNIKVTVLSVSLVKNFTDDTSYFAIALAFGLLSVGAIATGVVFLVLGKKKKRS